MTLAGMALCPDRTKEGPLISFGQENPACTKSHTRQRELKRAIQDTHKRELSLDTKTDETLECHEAKKNVDVMSDKNDELVFEHCLTSCSLNVPSAVNQ